MLATKKYLRNIPTKDEIIEFYINKNYNISKSVKELGCTRFIFVKLLKEYGINKDYNIKEISNRYPGNKIILPPREELLKLYINDNKTIHEISIIYGCSDPTVMKWLKFYEIKKDISLIKDTNKRKCLELYDDPNYNNKEKRSNTTKDKYGVEWFTQLELMKKKSGDTKEYRYGDRHFVNSEKAKQTNLEKYGVSSYTQTSQYHHESRKKYYCDGESFDSLPELSLWKYAKDHNEEIIRLPLKIEYIHEGKTHYYFPDFLYNGKLIEIKADYLYKKMKVENTIDNSKYKCMIDNGVEIMIRKDYVKYVKYFTSRYNKEEYKDIRKVERYENWNKRI